MHDCCSSKTGCNMTNLERAVRAYVAMETAQQRAILPILIAFSSAYPRKPKLRLVVNNLS